MVHRRAFTLIELLVVIAIIALLVSILLPSLKTARDLARTAVCMVNLKSCGTLIEFYANDYNRALPAKLGGGDFPAGYADFLVVMQCYEQGDPPEYWGTNAEVDGHTLCGPKSPIWFCPSDPNRGHRPGVWDKRWISYGGAMYIMGRLCPPNPDFVPGVDPQLSNRCMQLKRLKRHGHEVFSEAVLLADSTTTSHGFEYNTSHLANWESEVSLVEQYPKGNGPPDASFRGVALRHPYARGANMMFFDYHVETLRVPDFPNVCYWNWLDDQP